MWPLMFGRYREMKTSFAPTMDWCRCKKIPSLDVNAAALEELPFNANTIRAAVSPYSTREQVETMVETIKGDLLFQPSISGFTFTLY